MKGENVAKVEKVLERLERRSNKVAKAMVSPFPVSGVKMDDVSGDILHYMFCTEGMITKCAVHLGKKPKEPVSLEFSLANKGGRRASNFSIERQEVIIEPSLPVFTGDCLTITITPDEEEVIDEVWISFLWLPTVKDADAKLFLMKELENDLSEE